MHNFCDLYGNYSLIIQWKKSKKPAKAGSPAWRKTMQSASGTMGSAEKKNIHTAETKQSEKPTEDIEILNDIEI